MKKSTRCLALTSILSLFALTQAAAQEEDFIPIQISFTPMLAVPFGYGDVGLELGLIGALTRDVQGAAASGVFTISRSIHGLQANGVYGLATGHVEGLQTSGVFSLAAGNVEGAQMAGVFDIAGGRVDGAQLAGVFNVGGDVDGAQLAGVFNISGNYRGPIQAAGVFNVAADLRGSQIAGVANQAADLRGVQVASIVNIADSVRGTQIGLVNIAGRMEGIQIGLVNIAGNGIGGAGLLYDPESEYGWLFWQSGTPYLFTRLAAARPAYDAWDNPSGLVTQASLGSRTYLGPRYARSSWLEIELGADWYLGPAAKSLHDDIASIHSTGPATCPGSDPAVSAAFARATSLLPAQPWPSLSLSLGIPVFWRLEALVGFRSDVDLSSWPAMPEAFRRGMDSGPLSLFGENFHVYSKWFFGFRI
ncbi:MAG TPA: hypothetical protein VMV44_08015 [Rectinemataceae bacterium]|nr:hypothetical protein [Rectinemataceae bacterium]